MKTFVVAGSKGGVGKTTIATNLAAQAALRGVRTVLADADPQKSSTRWTERRADLDSQVLSINANAANGSHRWRNDLPANTDLLIVDAPAGMFADDLEGFLEHADAVIVPVMASALDIEAVVGFLNTMAKVPRVHQRKLPVGLVLNRARSRTQTTQQAMQMLGDWPYLLVAQLRDSQFYVVLAGQGRSVFDYRSAQAREHQQDWKPLLQWLHKL
ncbi:AAA family ATPase [Xylella fastidiosa subsp. fastidiosa]|jgi:chromosome partitioning protein|uniref:Partition protein n=2 Tax=Xylella fastidiosa TaxID=2371 RepID=Q87ED2_XYLFT|nr:ParA family protein [Xylella fastidiosa]ADN63376.1 cobyrinic acid ac-diamide synthase [Xylella fastidiosa subsp. fastidiosa GB514]KAF0572189.1 CMP-binding protein [Xylella fastidiosa subsp. fastidiosa Mus-1]AAO28265.1 partition protein [Xylella fastidiosa Temecula1]ACB91825.1 Cobyrinic acid ac-diamide synthase [Xylella fastidiosa M23]KGM21175.1 CMP-binding protein [Xylella fastidiosa]